MICAQPFPQIPKQMCTFVYVKARFCMKIKSLIFTFIISSAVLLTGCSSATETISDDHLSNGTASQETVSTTEPPSPTEEVPVDSTAVSTDSRFDNRGFSFLRNRPFSHFHNHSEQQKRNHRANSPSSDHHSSPCSSLYV